MRETRLSGLEGGGADMSALPSAPEKALGQSGESPLPCGEEPWGIEP